MSEKHTYTAYLTRKKVTAKIAQQKLSSLVCMTMNHMHTDKIICFLPLFFSQETTFVYSHHWEQKQLQNYYNLLPLKAPTFHLMGGETTNFWHAKALNFHRKQQNLSPFSCTLLQQNPPMFFALCFKKIIFFTSKTQQETRCSRCWKKKYSEFPPEMPKKKRFWPRGPPNITQYLKKGLSLLLLSKQKKRARWISRRWGSVQRSAEVKSKRVERHCRHVKRAQKDEWQNRNATTNTTYSTLFRYSIEEHSGKWMDS